MSRTCIVVACADERDLPAAIGWVAAHRQADVVAVAVDLGQGWDRATVERMARAAGATRTHVRDAGEEFARDYALPALRTEASGAAVAPMPTLGRTLVARALVEVAALEHASAIAVEADLAKAVEALNPAIAMVVLPPGAGTGAPHAEPVSGSKKPTGSARVELTVESGAPVALNGVAMRLLELVESLSVISGGDGAALLRAALRSLGSDCATGTVHLQFLHGECTLLASQRT